MIGLIAAVILAVLLNYLIVWRHRAQTVEKEPQILDSGMMRSVDRWGHLMRRDGVPRFRIRAERLLETRLGKELLEGIEASDLNPDGSVRNEIRSQKAEYDREGGLADFSGDVRLLFGEGVELRTHSLHYNLNSGIGETPDPLQFHSQEARGTARGLRFDRINGALELQNEVNLTLSQRRSQPDGKPGFDELHAVSDRAYGSEAARRILLQGNVRVQSESAELSGDNVEVILSPDGKTVTSLTTEGHAFSRLAEEGEIRQLSGHRIVFGIGTASQKLEKISVQGEAEFASQSPAAEESLKGAEIYLDLDPANGLPSRIQSRTGVRFLMKRGMEQTLISADQLTAGFDPVTNSIENLQVNGQARLTVESASDPLGQELQAEEILMSFRKDAAQSALEKLRAKGSARWTQKSRPGKAGARPEPVRTLEAALLEMSYSGDGNSLESGHASGKVVMAERPGEKGAESQVRRLLSDDAQFHFFPGNNRLKSILAEGHVQIEYEKRTGSNASPEMGKFRSESEKMLASFVLREGESAVDSVSQWGGFRYRDASRTATAARSDYDARSEILVLTGSPQIMSEDMGATTGERIEYDQKQKLLSVHKQVRSRLAAANGEGSFLGASSSSSPGIVIADELRYWVETGRARYAGKVQMLSENGQLQAEVLEILKGGTSVDARGNITHIVPVREAFGAGQQAGEPNRARNADNVPMIIKSAALNYIKESKTITYTGNVRLRSKDIDLSSVSLDAVMDAEGKRITRAKARGDVRILQENRTCKGETADYYLDPGKVVIVGNPAEILDPEKGHSYARRLTSFTADDRILLERQ